VGVDGRSSCPRKPTRGRKIVPSFDVPSRSGSTIYVNYDSVMRKYLLTINEAE
jgi:hypothetical protein